MFQAPEQHPLLACADAVENAVKEVAWVDPAFMPTTQKAAALRRLAQVEAEVTALRLKVLATAQDVAAVDGHRDIAGWLRRELRVDRPGARSDQLLAEALDRRWGLLAAALQEGQVRPEQARVIARALDELPEAVTPEERAKAEHLLVGYADAHTPTELRRLGRRVLEVIDPDRFDHLEAQRLAKEEAAAAARTTAQLRDNGDGTVELHARLPRTHGHRLKTYLEAFAQPRRQQLQERGRPAPYDRLLGQAFCHLLERIDPGHLPHHGGDATTVVVTIPLDALLTDLATAQLGFEGQSMTAGEARRLACNAALIPAVLGAHSEVLDLGRAARLHTPAQRKAIRLRDRTCRAQGCDVPATWCEVHHLIPWSRGGRTTVADGLLLCGHHHRLAHAATHHTDRLANGDLRFHRRT